MDIREKIRDEVIAARILAKTVDEATDEILLLLGVPGKIGQLCDHNMIVNRESNNSMICSKDCGYEIK